MKKNILFITPYFPPEVGAPQTRIFELTKKLKERGFNVTVICAFPNYPSGIIPKEYKNKLMIHQPYDGIDVYRTYIYETPNSGFLKRLFAHLTFALSSFIVLGKIKKQIEPDVAIIESPPLFMGITSMLIKLFYNMNYIFNVADIWPDAAIDLGILKNKFLIKLSLMLEKLSYDFASAVVTVTRGFARDIKNKGVKSDKIHVLPNGVDTDMFGKENINSSYQQSKIKEFKNKFNLTNKFTVLCAGTIGASHNIDFLLEVAQKFQDNSKICFLIAGDGSERERLLEKADNLKLTNVIFERYVPKKDMPALISIADVCVYSLLDTPSFRGRILARTYEYMAMGKPILMFAEGECVALLKTAGAGLANSPNDLDAATNNLQLIFKDEVLRNKMGMNATKFVSKNFSRSIICDKWENLFTKL